MHKLGLKLWSVNTDHYLREAKRLYEDGVFDYIEVYFVPDTVGTAAEWGALDIPCIVHAPHSGHGVNLASEEMAMFNLDVFAGVRRFADELAADTIIVHGGVLGSTSEISRQLKAIGDRRIVIENKPYFPVDGTDRRLAGSTPEEICQIVSSVGCGFCLDVGHAVASANAHGVPWRQMLSEFLDMNPKMFHLSDIDVASEIDQHLHYGSGNLPIGEVVSRFPGGTRISIETVKDSKTDLNDFRRDAEWLKEFI